MLVVGGREAEAGTVSVRLRGGEELGSLPIDEIARRMAERVKSKSLEL
jgi:threonyl-tRNA synthetase